jgi:excisionase family DNA binding protein
MLLMDTPIAERDSSNSVFMPSGMADKCDIGHENIIVNTQEGATMDSDRLLTLQEAARFLGVETGTILVWRCNGRHRIPAVKLGRNILRFRRADLEAFADKHAEPATASVG